MDSTLRFSVQWTIGISRSDWESESTKEGI